MSTDGRRTKSSRGKPRGPHRHRALTRPQSGQLRVAADSPRPAGRVHSRQQHGQGAAESRAGGSGGLATSHQRSVETPTRCRRLGVPYSSPYSQRQLGTPHPPVRAKSPPVFSERLRRYGSRTPAPLAPYRRPVCWTPVGVPEKLLMRSDQMVQKTPPPTPPMLCALCAEIPS